MHQLISFVVKTFFSSVVIDAILNMSIYLCPHIYLILIKIIVCRLLLLFIMIKIISLFSSAFKALSVCGC